MVQFQIQDLTELYWIDFIGMSLKVVIISCINFTNLVVLRLVNLSYIILHFLSIMTLKEVKLNNLYIYHNFIY